MKAPKKSEGPRLIKLSAINLGDLSFFRLRETGIKHLVERAEKMRANWGGKPPSPIYKAEQLAKEAIRFLLSEAKAGDDCAARALHRVLEQGVSLMNTAVRQNAGLWTPVQNEANGWPVIFSDCADDKGRRSDLLVHVGSGAFLNVVCSGSLGAKDPRWTETTPFNEWTGRIGAALLELRAASGWLASDDPKPDVFSKRVNQLLEVISESTPTKGIVEAIKYFRTRSGFDDRAEIANLILKWLDWETGGHYERILELRGQVVTHEKILRHQIKSLESKIKEWGVRNSVKYPTAAAFLREYLGPKTTERDIREAIDQQIRAHLYWKKAG
jgi:hypothetical protein